MQCHTVGEDYDPVSLILEFQPGETEKQVTVTINNDKKIERDETFQLYLSAGEGVHLTPFPRTQIVILNDDGKHKMTLTAFSEVLSESLLILCTHRDD